MSGFELVCAMRCGSRVGSYYQYYHSYRTAWDRGQEGAGAASLSARGAEGTRESLWDGGDSDTDESEASLSWHRGAWR